jgi:hypothetical protein
MSVIAHFGHEKRPVANLAYLQPLAAQGLVPEHRGRSRFRHPAQRRSRTMKRASRQRAFTGLTAVSGSSPTSAAHL